jgi:DNA-binding transcriptional MerR regulator
VRSVDEPTGHRTIGDVLTELHPDFPDITVSKIRFLETQGLLDPERTPSGYRTFSDVDVAQLRWVLTQQRDHFLPLKVIRSRLDAGDGPPGARSASQEGAPPVDLGPSTVGFDRDELMRTTGLDSDQLRELEGAGILAPKMVEGSKVYDGDDLLAARAASGLMHRGLEARHLRSYRVSVEREAGLLEQLLTPVATHGGDAGRRRSYELVGELAGLGEQLRRALLRRSLRSSSVGPP